MVVSCKIFGFKAHGKSIVVFVSSSRRFCLVIFFHCSVSFSYVRRCTAVRVLQPCLWF